MFVIGSIAGDFAAALGLFAGAIAVLGFLAQAIPVLSGASDKEVKQAMVIGGLIGCLCAIFVMLLSALKDG
ncbi:MAG TPA: hypothetical protein VEW07_09165 [Solirubrobacterales bacterium]|nr:hypothetical protein [Solirubrobacterales bacterium]